MEQVVRVHDWPGFQIARGSIAAEFSGLDACQNEELV